MMSVAHPQCDNSFTIVHSNKVVTMTDTENTPADTNTTTTQTQSPAPEPAGEPVNVKPAKPAPPTPDPHSPKPLNDTFVYNNPNLMIAEKIQDRVDYLYKTLTETYRTALEYTDGFWEVQLAPIHQAYSRYLDTISQIDFEQQTIATLATYSENRYKIYKYGKPNETPLSQVFNAFLEACDEQLAVPTQKHGYSIFHTLNPKERKERQALKEQGAKVEVPKPKKMRLVERVADPHYRYELERLKQFGRDWVGIDKQAKKENPLYQFPDLETLTPADTFSYRAGVVLCFEPVNQAIKDKYLNHLGLNWLDISNPTGKINTPASKKANTLSHTLYSFSNNEYYTVFHFTSHDNTLSHKIINEYPHEFIFLNQKDNNTLITLQHANLIELFKDVPLYNVPYSLGFLIFKKTDLVLAGLNLPDDPKDDNANDKEAGDKEIGNSEAEKTTTPKPPTLFYCLVTGFDEVFALDREKYNNLCSFANASFYDFELEQNTQIAYPKFKHLNDMYRDMTYECRANLNEIQSVQILNAVGRPLNEVFDDVA